MDEREFGELIRSAQAGDADAIRQLLENFEPDVRMAVRRKLPKVLRTQFDSMDFVQRVWTSVFAARDLDPGRFERREHLLGFLTGVAFNKVKEEFRRRTRIQKYDLRREEPLFVRRGDREQPREVPCLDPTPSEDLQRRERLEQMLEGRQPLEREVICLREQGLTFDEIAERTGVNERTARRVIESLRRRMEDRQWR